VTDHHGFDLANLVRILTTFQCVTYQAPLPTAYGDPDINFAARFSLEWLAAHL
jgi:hypothetical protein